MKSNDQKNLSRQGFSRRGFLKGAAIGAAAVTGTDLLKGNAEATEDGFYPATSSPSPEFDFTQQSGALQPDAIVDSACQFCNSLCRLKADSKFEPISWDEALETIAAKFLALRDAGEVRAIATAGNPLVSSANTNKVKEAYRQLEFYVYTGLFMEEPAYYADIILPVCSGFEMETVYMRRDDRAIRWQKQAVSRVGESKPDWEIWIDLAHTMAKLDKKNSPAYWTENFPLEWKDYRNLWATFVKNTPGMGGMTQERMEKRAEPLRWPCPSLDHPGVSTLYLDHPSWYQAVKGLGIRNADTASQDTEGDRGVTTTSGNQSKRFLTPSGKVEIYTSELEKKLAVAGHAALPIFYTHPEVTGKNPTIEYSKEFVQNPINPQALTQKVKLGGISSGEVHQEYPLMGMIGRPSVVHFHTVTQWTYTGKQMNGIRLVQIHPKVAQRVGIKNGDAIAVESPRGSITGTAQIWEGIREDTIFVPHTFGPMQKMAEELGTPYYEAANTLVDDKYYDNLSGQQAYKCFACRVRKA